MAIRIPIITVFDSKGLKQAQYQLNKVSGNFAALGRNATIAGAAIGGVAFALGKAVTAAANYEAEFEGVNQVFGNAAASVQAFASSASTSAGITETAALQASKVFGLFAVGAGLSQREAAKFSTTMVQLAGDLGSFNELPTEEALAAIQSGLRGQAEPLTKFGVFLDEGALKQAHFARTGEKVTGTLTAQQKMMAAYDSILAQTNIQQGDFVKYGDTFSNQLKTMTGEFDKLSREIGQQLLPVMAEVIPVIREVVAEVGTKLKAAFSKVDFKALATNVMNLAIFFVENIEAITTLVITLYTLNTAYNVLKVTTGLIQAGLFILGNTFTVTAGKIGLATGAVKLFRTALITTGIGALVVGLGFIIEAIINTNDAAKEGKPYVDNYGGAIRDSGNAADWAAGKYGAAANAATGFNNAVAAIDLTKIPRTAATSRPLRGGQGEDTFALQDFQSDQEKKGGPSNEAPARTTFAQSLRLGVVAQNRTNKLLALNLSEGAAQLALSTVENKKQFTRLITNLSKPGKAAAKQAQFNRSAAGIAEIESINAANEARAASDRAAEEEAERQRQAIIAAEKAAADERERIYKSFADSVTSLFASIRDSIVGAFSLPELGGSTDSIIRNMDKLLARVKSFSANITKLSSMGLDPTLLQQVIQAGPVAGARLAAGLVAGGADALARINAGYGEIQTLGSEIGMTGTQSRFNNQAQQNIYNINVEGGVGSGATIGKAIVDAIKAYERTSGAVWQGA
jgi:hypothetical protein